MVGRDGSALALGGMNLKTTLWLSTGRRNPLLEESDTPTLSISDSKGFETIIGSTDLVTPSTGETHKTSAASVVLFDKDKNVIWQAP